LWEVKDFYPYLGGGDEVLGRGGLGKDEKRNLSLLTPGRGSLGVHRYKKMLKFKLPEVEYKSDSQRYNT